MLARQGKSSRSGGPAVYAASVHHAPDQRLIIQRTVGAFDPDLLALLDELSEAASPRVLAG
jgi:hypothetical protein